MKMNGKSTVLLGLVAVSLFFMTPFNANAKAGDSWNRDIRNNSNQSVTVTVNSTMGNVWFENGCSNSKNGPCILAPHSVTPIKYTTTNGGTSGRFYINYGTDPQCEVGYLGTTGN